MMGSYIRIRHRTMRWKTDLVHQPDRHALVSQHLVREAGKIGPYAQRTLPCTDPRRPSGHARSAVTLFERCAMGRQGRNAADRSKHTRSDLLPQWCVCDLLVEDVVYRHRIRRDRTTRVDEPRAAILADLPASICTKGDILPPDLANVVRAVSAGFEIDNAYAWIFGRAQHDELCSAPGAIAHAGVPSSRKKPNQTPSKARPRPADLACGRSVH